MKMKKPSFANRQNEMFVEWFLTYHLSFEFCWCDCVCASVFLLLSFRVLGLVVVIAFLISHLGIAPKTDIIRNSCVSPVLPFSSHRCSRFIYLCFCFMSFFLFTAWVNIWLLRFLFRLPLPTSLSLSFRFDLFSIKSFEIFNRPL